MIYQPYIRLLPRVRSFFLKKLILFGVFLFSSSILSYSFSISDTHKNNITIRSDRVFLLNGKPFFPIMVNNELGPDNYHCQLRKPDGSSWGFNVINLMTQLTWHFKKFGGYCPDNPDLDYCGSGYRIRDIISGDASTSPQYHEILAPMGYDIDWFSNAVRIFNYLDNDMYVLADDYAFYPSTVNWFEQNSGCRYPNCIADCDSIYPRFDQTVRNNSIDRLDSLAKRTDSKLIGFYGMDDPTMMHTRYDQATEQYFNANIGQQLIDFQNTYDYAKSKYPASAVMYIAIMLYYPKAMNPGNPEWQNWNTVLNNWVHDEIAVANASDVLLNYFYDASQWDPNWCLYPDMTQKAMWFPNHLEQTLFPRVVNAANHTVAVMGGIVFDEVPFTAVQPHLDAKTKWETYIGLQKGVTGLYFFGWHKGKDNDTLMQEWNSIKYLVDTLVNVKHLDTSVFTKSNLGPIGHNISGSSNPNISYTIYQVNGWNDYYMLVTNNPNGVINEPAEPDNLITVSSSAVDLKTSEISEVFSGNHLSVTGNGEFQYNFACWGVALFHIKTGNSASGNIPDKFFLDQNYPNPFNPATHISYGLPQNSHVTLKIYNSTGQQVAVLVNSELTAGKYSVDFFGGNFPSGVYFYRLSAGNFNEAKKMILVK